MLHSLAVLCFFASLAVGQPTTQPQPRIVVHLLTFSPGNLVWERFGHNAIFILDVASDTSVAYDFGNFDFNQSDFVARFARGDMRYWAERKDPARMLEQYIADNRQIWAQRLRLPDDQLFQLWKNLEENAADDKKFYRYDYYVDNCSTRIRDHIDRVTGGALRRQMQAIPTEHSFRWHTRIGMESAPVLAAGVDFLTSKRVDHPLNAWEAAFLPAELMKYMQLVNADETGAAKLVDVAAERNIYLNRDTMVVLPAQPPQRWFYYLGAGVAVGTVTALCGTGNQRKQAGRVLAAAAWGLWGLLAGVAGLCLVFMWCFTTHRAAYANENLLTMCPLAIALVVIGPLAAFGKARKIARVLVIALAALSLLAVMVKVLPWFGQDNWRFIALSAPAHLGLLVGVWLRTRDIWDAERVQREFRR